MPFREAGLFEDTLVAEPEGSAAPAASEPPKVGGFREAGLFGAQEPETVPEPVRAEGPSTFDTPERVFARLWGRESKLREAEQELQQPYVSPIQQGLADSAQKWGGEYTPKPERRFSDVFHDVMRQAVSGFANIPSALGGLVSSTQEGYRTDPFAEAIRAERVKAGLPAEPEKKVDIVGALYDAGQEIRNATVGQDFEKLSPLRAKERQEAQQRTAEAYKEHGMVGAMFSAAKEMTSDPEQWLEQVANLAIMRGAGRFGTTGALTGGAVMQGGDVASDFRQQMEQQPVEAFENAPQYAQMIQAGMTPEQAKQRIVENTTRNVFALASGISLATNTLVPGGKSLEKVLAGETLGKATPGAVLKSMLGEMTSEGAEEGLGQLEANIVQKRTTTPDMDIWQGVGEAFGAGAALGGVMGGGASLYSAGLHNINEVRRQEKERAQADIQGAPDADSAVEAFQRSVQTVGPEDDINRILAQKPDASTEELAQAAQDLIDQYHGIVTEELANDDFQAPVDDAALQAYAEGTPSTQIVRDLLSADEASFNRVLGALPEARQEAVVNALAHDIGLLPDEALRAAGGFAAGVALQQRVEQSRNQAFDQTEAIRQRQVTRESEQGILEPTRDLRVEQATIAAEAGGVNATPTAMQTAFANAQPDLRAQRMAEEIQRARGAQQARKAAQTQAQQLADNEAGQFSPERTPLADIQALEETPVEQRGTGMIEGRPAAEISDAELRQLSQTATGSTRNAVSHEMRTRGLTEAPAAPQAAPEVAQPVPEMPAPESEGAAKTVASVLNSHAKEGFRVTARITNVQEAGAEGRAAEVLARLFKHDVVWFSAEETAADGSTAPSLVGGFVQGGDGKIYLNAKSAESVVSVVSHEMLHLLKRGHPEAYRALRDKVKADFDANPQKFADFKKYYNAELSEEALLEEAIADALGNQARTPAFWANVFARVAARHGNSAARGIITRVRNAIVRLISSAVNSLGAKAGYRNYITNLQEIGYALEEAAAKYVEAVREGETAEGIGETRLTEARRIGPYNSRITAQIEQRYQKTATNLIEENGKFYLEPTDGTPPAATEKAAPGPTQPAQPVRESAGRTHRGEVPEYGQAREDSVAVVGTHYSRTSRRNLSGFYYGTGLKGEEDSRLQDADPELRSRIYFYVDTGKGVRPEAGVGGVAHEVKLNNLYDLAADPLNLIQRDKNAMELAILKAGFDGYLIRNFGQQGAAVLIGDKHTAVGVQEVGRGALEPAGRSIPAPVLSEPKQIAQRLNAAKDLPAGEMPAQRWGRVLESTYPDIYEALNKAGLFESKEPMYRSELASMYVRGERAKLSAPRKKPGSDVGHKRSSKGEYVGAPAGTTSASLGALRARLRKTVLEGEPGRFWYEDSGKAILAASEGDQARAEKLAGLLAIYSPGTEVSSNTTVALKALYQWMAGEPIKSAMKQRDAKAQAWMDGTMGEEDALQIKTGNFFRNLMRKIDEERYGFEKQGATIDMWVARVLGYGSTKVGSERRYTFAETEVKRLANELGWEPQQVQAALWVAIKARIETVMPKVRETAIAKGWLKSVDKSSGKTWQPVDGPSREKYENLLLKEGMKAELPAEKIGEASYNFGTAIRERVAQISWEALPGASTGLLPGAFNAPVEQQAEYLQAMDQALRDADGVDLIAKKLGLPVLQTTFGPSAWQMHVGAGAQSAAAVATTRTEKRKIVVTPAARKLLNAYAAIRGQVLHQEAVVWHFPVYDRNVSEQNGVEIQFGRNLDYKDTATLYQALADVAGHDQWAPAMVPGGVRVLNFTDTPNPEFHSLVKRALSTLPERFSGWEFSRFATEGDYISNDWKEHPNGEGYRSWIEGAGRSDLQEWASGVLAVQAETVNRHFAEKYGWGEPAKLSAERRVAEGAGRTERNEDLLRTAAGGNPAQGWTEATRIRGKSGNPLRVFRGAGRELSAADFAAEAGSVATGHPSSGLGVWFADSESEASRYGAVAEHYLDIRRPKLIKVEDMPAFNSVAAARRFAESLRAQGYDGIVVSAKHLGGRLSFVAFKPEQALQVPSAKLSSERNENSEGRPIYPTEEGVRNFWEWFGDSKVVDDQGRPLVVYHGTGVDTGGTLNTQGGTGKTFGTGAFFSANPNVANTYASGAERNVMPVYLRLEHPVVVEAAGKNWDALGQRTVIRLPAKRVRPSEADLIAAELEGVSAAVSKGKARKVTLAALFPGEFDYADDTASTDDVIRWARKQGYEGVEFRDIKDQGPAGMFQGAESAQPSTTFVVFDPEQIKSATGNVGAFNPENPDIRYSPGRNENSEGRPIHPTAEGRKNFAKWFKGSRVVDDEGRPQVMYHGTTADFTVFDRAFGNVGGDLGAGFYFTNEPADVEANYAGEGPDLSNKIKLLAERIADEEDIDMEEARARARKQFKQHEGATMPVYLAVKNPVVLGGENETFLTYEEEYNEELDEYEEPTGTLVDFAEGLREVAPDFEDADADGALQSVWETALDGGGISASELINTLKTDENTAYTTDDEGKLAVTELLRRAFQAAGYDGFVDKSVDIKFGSQRRVGQSMTGMNPDTFHVIAFEPEQIKSASGNLGTFSKEEADIRFSAPRWNRPVPGDTWATPQITHQWWHDLRYKLQDKHIGLKEVQKAIGQIADRWNAYLQEELYHGRAAKMTADFIGHELQPLLEDMKARGVERDEFETYLWNRHAEERNVQIAKVNPNMQDAGSGIKTADARAYLAGLPQARARALEALAKRVDAINASTRQLLVDYGLEKAETIAAWENAYGKYVPLNRVDAESFAPEGGPGTGQGFSIRGAASKRATGSLKPVENILGNIAQMRERTITRGEKNRVATALYGLVLQNTNKNFWAALRPGQSQQKILDTLTAMGMPHDMAVNMAAQPVENGIDPRTGLVYSRPNPLYLSGPNVIAARIEGENRYVVLNANDPLAFQIASGLKNLDANDTGALWNLFRRGTQWMAAVSTQYNPIFGVVNLTRDVQEAALNLGTTALKGHQKEVLKQTASALRGIYSDLRAERKGRPAASKWAQLWEDFQKEGGQTGYRDLFRTGEERAREIEKQIRALGHGPARKAVGGLFDWLSDYNEAMENAVRLSAYKTGLDNGLSSAQAASIAKNLTVNFNKKGAHSTQWSALYAFFNASVQGTARIAQTVDLRTRRGQVVVAGGLLLGALQTLALAAAGFDDDDIPEFIKERNLIIPAGGKNYLSIPMPLGFHLLPNFGRIAMETVLGYRDNAAKTVGQVLTLALDVFNPIGTSATLTQTLTPTVGKPLVALGENKDWTGKPIAQVDFNSLKPTPGHTRAKDTATIWSKWLSEFVNYATGGTDYKKGELSPTPDQIDYLFAQIGGGVAREVSKSAQVIESAVTGEDLPRYKIPLVGRFSGSASGQAQEGSKFYTNLERINEHAAEVKGRREHGEPVGDYLRDNPEARLAGYAEGVQRQLTKLKRRKREMIKAGASKEQVKGVETQITALMANFNRRVKVTQRQAVQ